ncbi:uncharacterized protein LOC133888590 isoform X2 [Phragmites australis]|uniref:uncharacterized protein LOC133888590 isoform X2 n=1 Tax=Phragmites australis TaxID=29695 RepID=UPI002D773FF0|nr:uncharacterized protein LOC133888590 isoform X2 [Phragmites australis]
MDGGERTFKANFTGEGVALLRDCVKEKLRELMGDYSDDTLAEYVVVLLRNGRRKDEAAKELQVFLGDDNDAFVSWLWDHLSSNLHHYVQPNAVSTNDEAKSSYSTARELPVCSLTSSIKTNPEPETETQKTSRTHQKREWGGIVREQTEAVPLRSVVAKVSHAEEKAFHKSHEVGKAFHKSHSVRRACSPDMHNHRKRSREEDARLTKRASHQVIGAPCRLLQFAVRDAVRTVQPVISRSESASKRLRSVVSTLASDSAFDVTHVGSQRINSDMRISGATAALRAAAEAAEDVLKDKYSASVFNRLGGMPTLNATEESLTFREQDPEDGEYENINSVPAENKVEFHERNQYGGGDAYIYDRETAEAAGSAPDIDEYDNTIAVRYNGLGSCRNTLPSSGGKESLVVGYTRGAAEVRSRKFIAQGTHAGSGPRPSKKILNTSANISTPKLPNHETRDAAPFEPQASMEKRSVDARKSNVTIAHANTAPMTDKSKDLIHSSSMVEAQKVSSLGQPEGGTDSRTVFISNVHFAATKDALSRHFNKFGAILKTLIMTDGVTGQPTGSAYIEFMHKESAEQALTLNGTSFMSRILKVVRKSSIEVPQLSGRPRASRGSPFASRLIRTAYPRRMFSGAIRGRLPLRGGARSLQWKRDTADSTDAGKPSQTTPATPGNQLVTQTARSFTYTRTEPKPNDGAMV